jgi:hypothetical protein
MIKSLKPVLLISLCIIGCSCQKTPPLYEIPDWAKPYGFFKEGSYWIYQNDLTNNTDSTFVESFAHGIISQPDGYDEELCIINFSSGFLQSFNLSFNGFYCSISLSTINYHGIILDYRLKPGESWQDPGSDDWLKYIALYDTLVVNGQKYFEVVHNSQGIYGHGGADTVDLYTAKGVGLVKYEMHSDSLRASYSLLRYQVVPTP